MKEPYPHRNLKDYLSKDTKDEWEIDRSEITLGSELAHGDQFGEVRRGKAKNKFEYIVKISKSFRKMERYSGRGCQNDQNEKRNPNFIE